jgi:arylsulfatase A-like enzyme
MIKMAFNRRFGAATISFLVVVLVAYCCLLGMFVAKSQITTECPDCNVILISLDALRADHLGCYGYFRNTTPNIDRAAEGGIVFTNAFSQSAHTLSSHMSMFTSTYPTTHKVILSSISHSLPEEILTLPQILKIYGYKTAWFAPLWDPNLNLSAGFRRGIDETYGSPLLFDEGDHLLEWIENNSGQRFFAFFHTYEIHDPYIPPEPLNKKFNPDYTGNMVDSAQDYWALIIQRIRQLYENDTEYFFNTLGIYDEKERQTLADYIYSPSPENGRSLTQIGLKIKKPILDSFGLSSEYRDIFFARVNLSDPRDFNHLIALYDAEIFYTDQFIGRLLERLDRIGIINRTILIITADHGEEFMEHGQVLHGQLYDECIHIPLIFIIPRAESGIKVSSLTQSIDIMPTILEMLNIPIPSNAEGRSLVPAIKNGSEINDFVYSIWTYSSSVRNMEWKLVLHDSGTRELFHLPSDPGQCNNMAEITGDMADFLEAKIMDWIKKAELIPARDELLSRIDNETREKFIRTGYW